MKSLPSCSDNSCDCYRRGAADARRTVEAELDAERAVLAILAASLADTVDNIHLLVHPDDARRFDRVDGLPILVDAAVMPGSVQISSNPAITSQRLS